MHFLRFDENGCPESAWMRFLSRTQHSRWRLTRPMPMANTETGQIELVEPQGASESKHPTSLLYVPAWWIRGEVESHWSGLVRAATKSGKGQPVGFRKAFLKTWSPPLRA